jgi:lysophospholipase L1-like esterase
MANHSSTPQPESTSLHKPRIARILVRLGVSLVSVVVALLVLEFAARIIVDGDGMNYGVEMWKYARELKRTSANFDMAHEHVPNSRAFLMGQDVKISAQGLRDREFSLEKPSNTYRILVLGDSMTFGWGAAADQVYAKVLERLLNENEASGEGLRFEVINSGVGNYNTKQEVAYFCERGVGFEPDMVLLGFFVNDAEMTPRPSPGLLARHSYLHVLGTHGWDAMLRRRSLREGYATYYDRLYQDGNAGWEACQQALEELADRCHDRQTQLVILQIPEMHNLGEDYPFKDVHSKIAEWARSKQVSVIDPIDDFKTGDVQQYWVSAGDAHLNAKAHQIVASSIYQELRLMFARNRPSLGADVETTHPH